MSCAAQLACGDIRDTNEALSTSSRQFETEITKDSVVLKNESKNINDMDEIKDIPLTPQLIDENEIKLKERIAQCKSIIESLKDELIEEKSKLERESKPLPQEPTPNSSAYTFGDNINCDNYVKKNLLQASDLACLDSRLNCDENLIEYEKQLQRYQNTLNMAQLEKKNAIRKQMLMKAFNLKLLEVENQCNIELLRVKQSLQCLEPLRMIANKWKTNSDDSYDLNSFELIPRYPELNSNAFSDFGRTAVDSENKVACQTYENSFDR